MVKSCTALDALTLPPFCRALFRASGPQYPVAFSMIINEFMPKYTPSIPIQDCYGSVGELTYYHKDGRCYYRKRSRPAFPGTMLQMEHQEVHLRAIAAWQGLDSSVQKEWNAISPAVIVHRPPFDNKAHMSGYNLFVSAYHGFASLGNEHVPEPVPWEPFPRYALESVHAARVEGEDLLVSLDAFVEDVPMAERCRFLMRAQLVAPGKGINSGKMRNILATAICSRGAQVVCFPFRNYVSRWGLDLQEFTIHCRPVLLDITTGYRNIWRPFTFQLKL